MSEPLTNEKLLAALRQAALQPSLSRTNFETLRDAIHLIEDHQLEIWEFANPQHMMRRRPTHWMPLPEAPRS